jgi:hypothetical protein
MQATPGAYRLRRGTPGFDTFSNHVLKCAEILGLLHFSEYVHFFMKDIQ